MTCPKCSIIMKKRKTLPNTAVRNGMKWFNYYQCQKCKTNYAKIRNNLVSCAAKAVEMFGEDELEEYTKGRNNSCI